ncbi:MAG: carboxylating nicotinate-nucleotide diphosphorylase [Bryobacterales bacterium]|nr:carboxylating nicotinate-nucleotide diphosphorylase [Bryobacterales bacterium]
MQLNWNHPEITDIISRALAEDIGTGDVTTDTCVPSGWCSSGFFLAREQLVVAGIELLQQIYAEEKLEILVESGIPVDANAVIARVSGSTQRLLTLERTALNFVQRLSGIATLAARYVKEVEGTGCQVLDTRKTTPGLRRLEKFAAQAGGIRNHRMGLYDAILIKNNHITAAGGVRPALERFRDCDLPVKIEVRSFAELEDCMTAGATQVLLDNFTPSDVRAAMSQIAGRAEVEVSGGITLANVREYAETGADYVSSGAITHSARAVDISFRLDQSQG